MNNSQIIVFRATCKKIKNLVDLFLKDPLKEDAYFTLRCIKNKSVQVEGVLFYWKCPKSIKNTSMHLTIILSTSDLSIILNEKINFMLYKYKDPKIFLAIQYENESTIFRFNELFFNQIKFIICKMFTHIKQLTIYMSNESMDLAIFNLYKDLNKHKKLMHENIDVYAKTSEVKALRNLVSQTEFVYNASYTQSIFTINF